MTSLLVEEAVSLAEHGGATAVALCGEGLSLALAGGYTIPGGGRRLRSPPE